MTCHDSREYLYAFLDNELDSALSMEYQRHLEHCPECARESEIERVIQRQLTKALLEGAHSELADEATLAGAVGGVVVKARRGQRQRRGILVAAAVAIIIAPLLWLTGRSKDQGDAVPPFVELMVADLEHTLEKANPVEMASPESPVVATWLREQTGLAVSLPRVDATAFTLLGGRKCSLAGHSAAFALYQKNGKPVSLVAVAGDAVELTGMQQRDGEPAYWAGQCRGRRVLARQNGPLMYAVVADLPEAELVSLIAGIETRAD